MKTNLSIKFKTLAIIPLLFLSSCNLADYLSSGSSPTVLSNGNNISSLSGEYDSSKIIINGKSYDLVLSECSLADATVSGEKQYYLSIVFAEVSNTGTAKTITFTTGASRTQDALLTQGELSTEINIDNTWNTAGEYQINSLTMDMISITWDTISVADTSFQAAGYIDIKMDVGPTTATISGEAASKITDVFSVQKIYFNCTDGTKSPGFYRL
jgi:hypothetical protein